MRLVLHSVRVFGLAPLLILEVVVLITQAAELQTQDRFSVTLAESYVDRMRREGPVLDLSVRDAIQLALTRNLELEIENYNEELDRLRFVGTQGYYDPSLIFTVGTSGDTRPTTSVLDAGVGVATNTTDRFIWNSTFQQNVPWGGNFQAHFDNNRNQTNSTFSTLNPSFGSTFNFTFTQPLLKGFRLDLTARNLKIINKDRELSDSRFEAKVADIIQIVQNQYWELVFGVENQESNRRSMELAIVQFQNNEKRVEIGVSAPIEITSSRAEVSLREQEMIQSEVQIIRAQNALKRTLAPDPNDTIWESFLIPTDRPEVQSVDIDMDEAIRIGLESRPELEQLRIQMEQTQIDRQYWKKQGRPEINLQVNFGSNGATGFVSRGEDLDGDGQPDTMVPDTENPSFGNFTDAFGQVFQFDFRRWGVFANVVIPLRNRANEAELARNTIEESRLLSLGRDTQQMIVVEVRDAFESLATQKKRLEAAQLARELTEEQLEGENKRFEAGLSTNFNVLRFQRDLASATVSELRAQIDYQLAVIALRKAMYTIIDGENLTIAKRDGKASSP